MIFYLLRLLFLWCYIACVGYCVFGWLIIVLLYIVFGVVFSFGLFMLLVACCLVSSVSGLLAVVLVLVLCFDLVFTFGDMALF